jgi:uncharacterized protein (DUF885 family)
VQLQDGPYGLGRQSPEGEKALGDKFDLAWFHGVLKEGAMPLSLLEARIDERIAERLKA